MKDKICEIKIFQGYIHYYLNNSYLGLLVFERGELSDHRGVVRKNRLHIDSENLYKSIRTGLFTLLNYFLAEKLFLENDELQKEKADIVKHSDKILKEASQKIINNKMLGLKND